MQINRLFETIYLLLHKKTTTAKELAEYFEVSTRTIYRDIETLSSSGIPIYASKGKGGGISLLEEYVFDKSILSESDQNEILYALQGLSLTKNPQTEQLITKLNNLFNKNKKKWIEVDFNPWDSKENGVDKFTIFKDAILSNKTIEFTYFNSSGEKSIRRVEPIKLIFKINAWYLQAFCLKKNKNRTFKISRISNLEIMPQTFQERAAEELDEDGQSTKNQNLITLCLKITAQGTYRIYDDFKEQDITKNNDGSFTVTVSLPDGEWLIKYLLSFGADLEVLSPQNIRKMLKMELNKINDKY